MSVDCELGRGPKSPGRTSALSESGPAPGPARSQERPNRPGSDAERSDGAGPMSVAQSIYEGANSLLTECSFLHDTLIASQGDGERF